MAEPANNTEKKMTPWHKRPEKSHMALRQENQKLAEIALRDEVTGLPNEKQLTEVLNALENLWSRDSTPEDQKYGSFIVADLTGLHDTNETYGRNTGGNDYLKSVGKAFTETVRPTDRVFRMGTSADEFVLHLSNITTKSDVLNIIYRVNQNLKKNEDELQSKYPGIKFGLSYSIATYKNDHSPKTAYEEAVQNLKEAKKSKTIQRVGNVGIVFADQVKHV